MRNGYDRDSRQLRLGIEKLVRYFRGSNVWRLSDAADYRPAIYQHLHKGEFYACRRLRPFSEVTAIMAAQRDSITFTTLPHHPFFLLTLEAWFRDV